MRKKMFTMALLLSLVLQAFTGCGGDTAGSADSGDSGSSATPAVTEDGKDELTIMTVSLPAIQDMATNEMTLWMEEQTNVHVTWETIPEAAQGGTEKLALILSGGDYPDVFMNCPFTNDTIAKYGPGEGILMPIDDYINEEKMPTLMKTLEELEPQGITLDSVRQMDGKLYGLPNFDTCQHCEFSVKMWYYQPWLEALNVEPPTTIDEFYDVLVKIKNTDLNGNGQADEIPLIAAETGGWQQRADQFIMNSFIYYDYDANGVYLEDGKVVSSIDQPEFREGLRFLNKLYSEGLLYEGSLTQDYNTNVKIVENPDVPLVGFNPGGFVGMFANLGGERASQFRPLEPLTGPDGYRNTPQTLQVPTTVTYILSSTCQNPDAAMRYADIMYTEEATLSIRGGLGLKGKGYRDAEEGETDFDGNQARWTMLVPWNDKDPQNASWLALGVWNYTSLRAAQSVPEGTDMWSLDGNEWQLYVTTKELYAPVAETGHALPPLNYTTEEAEEIAQIKTDLFNKSYFDSARYDFITGARDLDADWDEYVNYLAENGYDRYKEILQTAYDRQYK